MSENDTVTQAGTPPSKAAKRDRPSIWHMFNVLGHSIRQYKKATIFSVVFSVLQAVFECCIPLVMSYMITALQAHETEGTGVIMEIAGIYAAILVVLAAGSFLTSYLGAKYSSVAAVGFAANLRQDIFYQTTRFSFENIDKFSKASLVTRMTTDVFHVQNAFMMIIRVGVLAPVLAVISLICTFIVGWSLSWIYCITVPIIVVVMGVLMPVAVRIFTRAFPRIDELNKDVEENIRGVRTVKTYTREDYEDRKFNEKNMGIFKEMSKGEIIAGLTNPLLTCTINISIALFVGFGAYAMADGNIDAGNFQALISYGVQMLNALMLIAMTLVQIAMAFAAGERILQVEEEKPSIAAPENGLKEIPDGSISFRDVHFAFSDDKGKDADEEALKGIDLEIASGETIGIIGGTGSSKSTLVNMIPRFYDPQEGEVDVGGVNVKDYDLVTLRDGVSMVLQKNVLFGGTLRENLQWGDANATDEQIMRACDIACATEFVDQLPGGLDYMVEQGGTNFSGGQKQRLCIARAILKNPRVLIFDDSTSAVDTKTDAKIRASLKELLPGVTKIIIAQRISSVADADRVIVMDAGSVESVDRPSALFDTSRIFREVCDLQGVRKEDLR